MIVAQSPTRNSLDRRTFLKTTGASHRRRRPLSVPRLRSPGRGPVGGHGGRRSRMDRARPFRLTQVSLGDGLFQQKRDRMLNYARNYGSDTDIFAGPDRLAEYLQGQRGPRHQGRRARGKLGKRHRVPAGPLRRPLHEHAGPGLRRYRRRGLQAEARLHDRGSGRVPGGPGGRGEAAHAEGVRAATGAP